MAARARRLFDQVPDAPERGYLLCVDAERSVRTGQWDAAADLAATLLDIGERYDDPTIQAHALFTHGVLAVARGEITRAHDRLDEAMILVQSGDVRPEWAGNLYCRMIQLCTELGDLPRAQHWTAITEQWCAGYEPGAMFAGVCRVHRAHLLRLDGQWQRAARDAERATVELEAVDVMICAEAHYLLGELHRLHGDLDAADAAYRRAHRLGKDPLPGMALLHMHRGHTQVAASILDAVLAGETAPLVRAPLLDARIEVAVAIGDLDSATHGVRELEAIAETHGSPVWEATARRWRGVVLHARGRDAEAVGALRAARREWQRMHVPYQVARTRLDLAAAAERLGDHDTAERERSEAESSLDQLGARRDLARLRAGRGRRADGLLSPREVEVVAVIASGMSNREAAGRLHISERTVARHLANIYLKTQTATRTAAVAWARQRDLI